MASQWVVKTAQGERGPFTAEQLRALAAARRISGSTFVRLAGETQWVAAGRVEGLFESPKFPSKEDGAWSDPLDDTEDALSADATMDEKAALNLLREVMPMPGRISGNPGSQLAGEKLAVTHSAHVAEAVEERPFGGVWSPLRLAVVSVVLAVGAVLLFDLLVRFALTMATAESQRTVGLTGGVVVPLLLDGGLLVGLLVLLTVPVFWLCMLVHCLKYEPRGGVEKLTWTLVLLALNIVGAILYYVIERPRVEAERK